MADTSVGADTLAALANAGSSDRLIEVTAPSATGLTGMRDALPDRPGADAVVPDLLVAGIEDQIGHSARRVGVRRTRSLVSVSSSKQQNGVTTLRHLHAACSHQRGQGTTPTGHSYCVRLVMSENASDSLRGCADAVEGESDTTNNCTPSLSVTVQ